MQRSANSNGDLLPLPDSSGVLSASFKQPCHSPLRVSRCPGPQAEASHAHLAWQSTGLARHMSSALRRAGSGARAMPAPQVPTGQESMRLILDQQTPAPLSTSPSSEQQLHLGNSILRFSMCQCWASETCCMARGVGHVPMSLGGCT